MNNYLSMSGDFERQKRMRALAITAGIGASLLLAFILIKWSMPIKEIVPPEQFIEIILPEEPPIEDVNLGNNDVGSGKIQPIVTGRPSSQSVSEQIAHARGQTSEQSTRDIETDDKSDGPVVTKAVKPDPNAKEITTNTNTQTVSKPTAQAKPKALMRNKRGDGIGGNTTEDGFNKSGGQGPGDGPGDKGVQNGNPKGRSYIGANILKIPPQNFVDDFKEGGTIILDIEVDEKGRLLKANYLINGSSLPKSSKQYSVASTRAREINYPKIDGGFKHKLRFNFSIN